MSARASLFFRGALPRLGSLLGSWKLSVVLTVTAALYFAQLAVFARGSPAEVVSNIAALAPFWAIYFLLLLNTGACLWLRLPLLRRELRPEALNPGAPPSWTLPTPGLDATAARAALSRLGFAVRSADEKRLWGLKHRWAALGTWLFHGAFFVVAAGFITTLAFREEFRLVAAVGEEFSGESAQVLSREGSPVLTQGLPEVRFTHQKLEPGFWNDQLLFTQLKATVLLADGAPAELAINRPLWLGFGTFLRLTGFGYAPRYELRSLTGEVLESAFLKLNVFPPGKRDFFRAERYPHRVYLQLYPDVVLEAGTPRTRTMNLVNPGFLVEVLRGRVDLGGQLLRGQEAFFFEAMSVRFPEVRYWGEFKLLRDPGAPVVGLGLLIGLAGLALKVRGRRAEVEWLASEGGGDLRGWGGQAPSLARPVGSKA